ncbi:hypothetical protein [Gemmatimonas sp.]|uniref:hypothetical protein n=1 Tax=Gemmatimonas sp. TaxID=1962908 RepID=UPI003564F766
MEQEALGRIWASLARLPMLETKYFAMATGVASHDGARSRRVGSDIVGERAYQIASAHVASALDHLSLMRSVMIAGQLPPYSLFSLARTAYESAVQALWLMDPDLDDDQQLARAVGAQFAEYNEREKAENDMGLQPAPGSHTAAQRRATYMTNAVAKGLTKLAANGDVVPLEAIPATYDLFHKYGTVSHVDGNGNDVTVSGGTKYRLFSAFAHGKQWANMLITMQPTETLPVGGVLAHVEASDELLVIAYSEPVDVLERALDGYCIHAELATQ